jgi:hypothetical protein
LGLDHPDMGAATKHSGNTIYRIALERRPAASRLMNRTRANAHHSMETVMRRHPATIICDAARRRAPQPASSQAGDWHDVTGHHRYYGSSAINGGERIVEDRRRRRFVNLCGF